MKFPALIHVLLLAIAGATGRSAPAGAGTNAVAPVTARDFYNAGTRLFAAKEYAEAEKMFQAALAGQDERVQPVALYNVGHTRFAAGMERLDKGPDAKSLVKDVSSTLAAGERAIQQSEAALAENNTDNLLAAYLQGHGARSQLRDAEKALSDAMEIYGKTLEQWLRAADDFKGANELDPADTNATHNAEIVDRGIAKLVDAVRKMQAMQGELGRQREDLGKLLSKLKGRIPAPNAPPGSTGDDDEDDQGVDPGTLAGQREEAGHSGDQIQIMLSPDQASQILSGLSLDGTRRLEMSDQQGQPLKDRKGRNW